MKDVFLKKLIYVASYFFFALFMEFITFNVMGLGVFAEYYWFDLMFVALIAMFIFIIPSFVAEAIIIMVLLALQATLSFVNQAMNNDSMLHVVFTFSDIFSTSAVAGVFSNDYVSWPFLIALIMMLLGELFLLLFLRRIRVKAIVKFRVLAFFVIFFMSCEMLLGSFYGIACAKLYSPSKEDSAYFFKDDKKLYEDMEYAFKVKAFKRFGTFAFYYRNFIKFINFKSNEEITNLLSRVEDNLSDGDFSSVAGRNYTPYTGAYSGNNLIMIMMESAEWYGIDEELTPTLYALKTQGITSDNYISKNKTNQSEAISILGSFPTDCNLQEKLKADVTDGNISYPFSLPSVFKRDGYKTSYMHDNVGKFYNRASTYKALGFDNLYFYEDMLDSGINNHKTTNDFYDFESDYEALKTMKSQFVDVNKPFMSFFTTMCMHGNYNDLVDFATNKSGRWDYSTATDDERRAFKNDDDTNDFFCDYYDKITIEHFKNLFPNLTEVYSEDSYDYWTCYLRYKQYQAAYMDLDRGISELLSYLEENNVLDKTTIVLFADHDGYYHNQNYYLRGYELNQFYMNDLYCVPFIMYDGSLSLNVNSTDYGNYDDGTHIGGYDTLNHSGQAISKIDYSKNAYIYKDENGCLKLNRWSSPYDIVPTLLDLFGYSFNKNLYQGESVFASFTDVERAVFYSMESGIITDKIFMSSEGKIYYFDKENNQAYFFDSDRGMNVFTIGGERLAETDEIYIKLIGADDSDNGLISLFNKQTENFTRKKSWLDQIYNYKYFNFNGVKDNKGNVVYPFADINKNVYKIVQ